MKPKTDEKNNFGKGKSKVEHEMDSKERAAQAMRLRAMRVPYDEIARQLGFASRGAAHNAVQRALNEIPREAAKELRISELESLDVAESGLARRIAQGELAAIDRMLRIKDLRAKLTGLYEEANTTGVDEVKAVLSEWVSGMFEDSDDDTAE